MPRRREYLRWRQRFKDVYKKFIEECPQQQGSLSPLKIAVLDTGIDMTHPDIVAREEQIKSKYNWTDGKRKHAVQDNNGHGTFVTGLLLDYAPDAELYVAKIAEDSAPSPPGLVAKVSILHTFYKPPFFFSFQSSRIVFNLCQQAIDYAVDKWKVDIISMSFGYPTDRTRPEGFDELEGAILNAYHQNVLMFAAASNSGANLDRAHPARNQNVICIHSTDAQGNRSRFSPTALIDDKNLATVGEAVESAWPVRFCDRETNPNSVLYKSGTSYATPIAVGIASFLIQYARLYLPQRAGMMKVQMNLKDVLARIAQKRQNSENRDGYTYVALNLYQDSLFGMSDKTLIDGTLAYLL